MSALAWLCGEVGYHSLTDNICSAEFPAGAENFLIDPAVELLHHRWRHVDIDLLKLAHALGRSALPFGRCRVHWWFLCGSFELVCKTGEAMRVFQAGMLRHEPVEITPKAPAGEILSH
jgi:hypothetical protein